MVREFAEEPSTGQGWTISGVSVTDPDASILLSTATAFEVEQVVAVLRQDANLDPNVVVEQLVTPKEAQT